MLRSNAIASRRGPSTALRVWLSSLLLTFTTLLHAQTWTGGGANGNWSTTANWSGGTIPGTGATLPTFNNNVNTTVVNDLTGLPNLTGITFGSAAGAFVVTGNSVNLSGDMTVSGTTQINYNAPVVLISGAVRNFNVVSAAGELVVGASLSGTNGVLTKVGRGLLTLTAANSYTGGTDIQDGILSLAGTAGVLPTTGNITLSNGATLRLLNSSTANNTNRLVDTQAINMNSGKIVFSQSGGAVNYSETVGTLTLNGGVNSITASQADSGQTSAITFTSLVRNGGVIDFSGTGLGDDTRNRIVISSAPNNDGIIGGYATSGLEFAKYDATIGSVRPLQAAEYLTTDQGTWVSSSNVKLTASPSALSANRQINSLNIAAASATTVNLASRTLRVESGGVLVSGSQPISFQYGTLTAGEGNNTAGNLILHQYSSATFTIGARIANNGTGPVSVTKAGTGNLTLTEASTYTGATQIYSGTLRNAVTNSLPNTTALTMGDSSGTSANLDMTGVSQTLTGLSVVGNTTTAHVFSVTAGETLTVNGNVSIGANVANIATNSTFYGGGSLVVSNTGGVFQLGLGTGNINYNSATLDLTGLSSFTVNLGTTGTASTSVFRVGDNSGTSATGSSIVKLPASTTITAARISIGAEAGSLANDTMSLGSGSTVLNTNTLDLGTSSTSAGARGTGILNFGSSTGTLKVRAADGVSAATTMNVGFATVSTTSGNLLSTFDSRGHQADILVGALNIGGRNAGSGITTVTFDFDTGSLVASTVNIGQKAGTNAVTGTLLSTTTLAGGTVSFGAVTLGTNTTATGGVTGTLTFSGATATVGAVSMASATTAGGTATANLNLTSGSVTFGGNITRTGGAGTANANVTLNGATVDMGGFAIGSGTSAVTFNAQAGILKNVGAINGTGGLTKTGTGTLELQGSNGYSGATTVSAGTLRIATIFDGGAAGTLGSSAADATGLVLNGGTLQYTGGTGSSNRLFSLGTTAGSALDVSGTGPLSLGASGSIALSGSGTRTLTLTGSNTGDNLLAASLGDDGANASSLTKTGTGTWLLTGTHSYSGTTTVSGGTLRLDFSGTGAPLTNIVSGSSGLALGGGTLDAKGLSGGSPTQAFASLAVNVGASVASVSLNGASSLSVNFGGASIARNAGGTVNFLPAATNSFTATNNLNNSAGILGGYALVNGTDWASRDASGNITSYSAYTTSIAATAVTANTTNYSLTGTQTTRTGNAAINSLKLSGSGTLPIGATTLTFTGAAGGLLYAPASSSDVYNITGTGLVGSGTTSEFIVSVNQGTLNLANPMVSTTTTAGSMTKAGAGTLVYTGTSAYTGATWVNGGTLEISGTGTINSLTGSVIVAPNGTLRLNSTNAAGAVADTTAITVSGTLEVRANEIMGGLAGAGTVANNGSTNAVLTEGNSNGTTTFSGAIQDGSTGTLGLTKAGTGTFTLNGSTSNTNTGVTSVNAGTMSLAKTGGALAISGNVTVGDGAGATDILILNGSEQIANTSIVTVTGGTTFGVFRLNGNTETIGGLASAGSAPATGAVDNGLTGTTAKVILNTTTDQDFSGVLQNGSAGTLALTKTGAAQQTLSGTAPNTIAGATTVLGGTLKLNKTAGVNALAGTLVIGDGTASAVVLLGASNQIPDATVPMLAGSGATAGTLRLAGNSETLGGLSSSFTVGGGVVENKSGSGATGTLTVNVATNTSQTFTGILRDGDGSVGDGSLAFVKSGGGTQVLTGDNTHSGGTTISAGTLVIGNGGATGSLGSGAITNNGTLVINRTGSLTLDQAVGGTGSMVLGGGMTLTLSGNTNSYSGDTIIDQATLLVTNTSGSATGTGNVLVANTSTLAGTGIVGGGVTVNVGGLLQVGNLSGDSARQILQINGLLGSQGTLMFDLWGDDHGANTLNADLLAFGGSGVGTFSLGGTLTVNGNGINNWQAGDQWQLFDWGSILPSERNVAFTSLNLPSLPGGLTFDTSMLGITGILSITATPEPSRLILCLAGLLCIGLRRRR